MTEAMSILRDRFRSLHHSGTFVLPNPWDVGSARILEHLGFPALATTSAGFAAALGRLDQHTTRDQLVDHVGSICAAVAVPLNVDAERCFADQPGGVTRTIDLLAEAGASGISIEDYDPTIGQIATIDASAELVGEAVEACRRHGITLTARSENHLYGADDLDDTIARLRAYRAAGADVTYAPGLTNPADIERLVTEVGGPINVLALQGSPPVDELRRLGVRRVSMGAGLAWAAYGALAVAAEELRDRGTTSFLDTPLPRRLRVAALADLD